MKNRALTELLEKAGNRTVEDAATGKRVARKRIIARSIWELAAEGKTVLPDGTTLRTEDLDPREWIGLLKWIYAHIDGPPKTEMGLDVQGNLTVDLNWGDHADNENNDAEPA